ncbi:hypothetical protein [Azospirillum endophyticum]
MLGGIETAGERNLGDASGLVRQQRPCGFKPFLQKPPVRRHAERRFEQRGEVRPRDADGRCQMLDFNVVRDISFHHLDCCA